MASYMDLLPNSAQVNTDLERIRKYLNLPEYERAVRIPTKVAIGQFDDQMKTRWEVLTEDRAPNMLPFFCERMGIPITMENGKANFMAFRLYRRWVEGVNKYPDLPEGWAFFGKVKAGSKEISGMMVRETLLPTLEGVFPVLGEMAGYGQLLTSDVHRGFFANVTARYVGKEAGPKGADGASYIPLSLAKKLLPKEWKGRRSRRAVAMQFRLLSNDALIIGKGTFYCLPDKVFARRFGKCLITVDKDQLKVGRNHLKEGQTFECTIGICNIDADGDLRSPISWQTLQFLPDTEEVHECLGRLMRKEMTDLAMELVGLSLSDGESRLKVIKRLVSGLPDDLDEDSETSIFASQRWDVKLLLAQIDAPLGKFLAHIFAVKAMKIILGGGVMSRSYMLKTDDSLRKEYDHVGFRYPHLIENAVMLCSKDGWVPSEENAAGQADHDGDLMKVVEQITKDQQLIASLLRSVAERRREKGEYVLDIPSNWEMVKDSRPLSAHREKFHEQVNMLPIGIACNRLQMAVQNDAPKEEQHKIASLCHATAQVLKKTPAIKDTGKYILDPSEWWESVGLPEKVNQDPRLNMARKRMRTMMEENRAGEYNQGPGSFKYSIKLFDEGFTIPAKGKREAVTVKPFQPIGMLDKVFYNGCKIAIEVMESSGLAALQAEQFAFNKQADVLVKTHKARREIDQDTFMKFKEYVMIEPLMSNISNHMSTLRKFEDLRKKEIEKYKRYASDPMWALKQMQMGVNSYCAKYGHMSKRPLELSDTIAYWRCWAKWGVIAEGKTASWLLPIVPAHLFGINKAILDYLDSLDGDDNDPEGPDDGPDGDPIVGSETDLKGMWEYLEGQKEMLDHEGQVYKLFMGNFRRRISPESFHKAGDRNQWRHYQRFLSREGEGIDRSLLDFRADNRERAMELGIDLDSMDDRELADVLMSLPTQRELRAKKKEIKALEAEYFNALRKEGICN